MAFPAICCIFSATVILFFGQTLAYEEAPCSALGGSCMSTSLCPTTTVIGKCPTQPTNIRCCLPYQESACTNAGGRCKYTTACTGTTRTGLCPTQPTNVKCCFTSCGCSYDYATTIASGPQPGAIKLKDYFIRRYGGRGEIYNPRTVAGSSTLSLHAEGRAVDLYVSGTTGRRAFEHAVYIACANGIQEVIFNRRIWTKAKGEYAYTGVNPHTDHVHIGLNKCGAQKFNLY